MDYQAIIEALTEERVKEILHQLDIPFEDCGSYLIMPTYCHHHKDEEASKKLYYYKNNKVFMCYSNCGSQSIFKFLKNFYESQGIEYDWYSDIYELVIGNNNVEGFTVTKYKSLKEKYGNQRKEVELPEFNKGVLDCFVKEYPIEWLNDHITKETMDKFNIRYSITQNKIIIPHYDINDRLVGIRGRALNPEELEIMGKYMPVQIENIWYKHPLSMNLYGLNFTKENVRNNKICFLYESEKAVMQHESFSVPNCAAAVCGNKFNKFQLNILMKYCQPEEIIVCFDNEEIKGEHKYFDYLYNICKKYNKYCNFSFIYDREGLTNKKDSPSDRGEEIFKKLIERRVKVK